MPKLEYFNAVNRILHENLEFIQTLMSSLKNLDGIRYCPTLVTSDILQRSPYSAFAQQYVKLYTGGVGHCLYDAVSLALQGNENLRYVLRLVSAFVLMRHSDYYKLHNGPMDLDNDFESYVRSTTCAETGEFRSLESRFWGGTANIHTFSVVLQRRIHVFSQYGVPPNFGTRAEKVSWIQGNFRSLYYDARTEPHFELAQNSSHDLRLALTNSHYEPYVCKNASDDVDFLSITNAMSVAHILQDPLVDLPVINID